MQSIMMLYVGDAEAGERIAQDAQAHGDWAYIAPETLTALGMYITYMPNVTVIDAQAPHAAEVYQHLRSIDAAPIILLTDDQRAPSWALLDRHHSLRLVSRQLPAGEVIEAARTAALGGSALASALSQPRLKRHFINGAIPTN
ncbi:hypothetical protein FBR02_05475 [Anaerolineae bacterium CFX9]|nr:hypothetical protein [Anaerolineae bacterium CFX9]